MVKNPSADAGDTDLIHVLGRSPGEGNGNTLQYSCLENLADRDTVHGVAKSHIRQRAEHGPAQHGVIYMQFTKQQLPATLCLVVQSRPALSDTVDCIPPGSSVHGDSPGKDTEVSCPPLLQGIFPTQGSNPSLPHCRQILYRLNHQESSAAVIAIVILTLYNISGVF